MHPRTFWIFCLTSAALASAAAASGEVGRVVQTVGQVNANARTLKPGDPVFVSDQIICGAHSTVKLLMRDRTILDLNSGSKITLSHYDNADSPERNVELKIDAGTVRSSVTQPVKGKGKFFIKTRSATMGVRGTEFVVAEGTSSTQLTVLKGAVAVGSADPAATAKSPVLIGAGYQLTATASAFSSPQALSAQQLGELTRATRIKDNTFNQAVSIDSKGTKSSASTSAALASLATAASGSATTASSDTSQVGLPGSDSFGIVPTLIGGQPVKITVNFTK